MTNRPQHPARATPPLRRGRQVALAASMALVAVTGTATIAWSALSLALGPGLSAGAPPAPEPAEQVRTADTRGFAEATRDQAAPSAPAALARDVVVLSTRSSTAQRLDNAVQPELFGGSSAPARIAPVARPAAAAVSEDTVTLRPVARPSVATPDPVVEPVVVAATTPEPRGTPVSRPRMASVERESRLQALWNVGLFR